MVAGICHGYGGADIGPVHDFAYEGNEVALIHTAPGRLASGWFPQIIVTIN